MSSPTPDGRRDDGIMNSPAVATLKAHLSCGSWEELFALPAMANLPTPFRLVLRCSQCGHQVTEWDENAECEGCLGKEMREWVEAPRGEPSGWLSEIRDQLEARKEYLSLLQKNRPLSHEEGALLPMILDLIHGEAQRVFDAKKKLQALSQPEEEGTAGRVSHAFRSIPFSSILGWGLLFGGIIGLVFGVSAVWIDKLSISIGETVCSGRFYLSRIIEKGSNDIAPYCVTASGREDISGRIFLVMIFMWASVWTLIHTTVYTLSYILTNKRK